jgi:hypothetical protein
MCEGENQPTRPSLAAEVAAPSVASIARRGFVLASLGFLAACASTPTRSGGTTLARGGDDLPGGLWTSGGELPPQRWSKPATPAPVQPKPRTVGPEAKPPASTAAIENGFTGRVIPRARWTMRGPDLSDMRPMLPVTSITVHHEGMEAFTDTSTPDTIERLRRVWNGHDGRGFGDIGYHFVVDRAGRIWEGRSLRYQGAHVRSHNEGNIGIMCLGNFDEQRVSEAQRAALEHQLRVLSAKYRVKSRSIKTHKEWVSTACPGRDLQRLMGPIRTKLA